MDKLSQFPVEAKDELCKKLQNDETDFDTTRRIAKGLDCVASLRKTGVCYYTYLSGHLISRFL